MLSNGMTEHTPVGPFFLCRTNGLGRPDHRDAEDGNKLMKTGHHTAAEAHPQMRRDVPLERPQPMILPLPGKPKGFIPKAAKHPVAEAFQDDPNRRMMPGPVPERPHGVHGAAVRATPASQFHEAVAVIKVAHHKTMTPNPGTAATGAQTRPRPQKRILPPEPENLLDTHHEKKRQ